MVALYEATDGANWTKSENWLTDAPTGTWYGVFTDGSGRVTHIFLESNELSGPLPDLSAFTSLTTLDLSFNKLTGAHLRFERTVLPEMAGPQ